MSSLFKVGKTYYAKILDRDGKTWKKVSTRCQYREAALRRMKQIEGEQHRPKLERRLLGEFLHEHLALIQNQIEPATWTRYSMIIQAITEEGSPLAGLFVEQVDVPVCAGFVRHRLRLGRKRSTVTKEVDFLKRCLRAARKERLIATEMLMEIRDEIGPAEMPELKGAHAARETFWYPDEIEILLEEMAKKPNDLRDGFLLALYTGMRSANVLGLKEGQVNLTCDPPQIRLAPHQTKMKRPVLVTLSPVAAEIIRRRHSHSLPETPDRKIFSDYSWSWKQLRLRLEAEGRIPKGKVWHDLRRTYATYRLAAGIDPKTVQRELAHKRSSMTMDVYGQAVEDAGVRTWAEMHFSWTPVLAVGPHLVDPAANLPPGTHLR